MSDSNRVLSSSSEAVVNPSSGARVYQSVASGDTDVCKLRELINDGAPVNYGIGNGGSSGWTPLHVACITNQPACVKALLQCDADVQQAVLAQDNSGNTALHLACQMGSIECARLILGSEHCDPGMLNEVKKTPLGVAVDKLEDRRKSKSEGRQAKDQSLTSIVPGGEELLSLVRGCKKDTNYKSVVETVMNVAVTEGDLMLLKCLVGEMKVAVSGTQFLLACKRGQANIVEYLLSEGHSDPNYKADNGDTAFTIADWRRKDLVRLLTKYGAAVSEEVYTRLRKQFPNVSYKEPLAPNVKILVIGDKGEGKSSLVGALSSEPTFWTPLRNLILGRDEVSRVSQLTAGIQPLFFNSSKIGSVILYDFAGQESYYSSNSDVSSIVAENTPILLVVVALHKEDVANIQSVNYWLGNIESQCPKMQGKAPLIIIGSHRDMVDQAVFTRKKELIGLAVQKFKRFEFIDVIPVNCRYSYSDEMKQLRYIIGERCKSVRSRSRVTLRCQVLNVFLLQQYRVYAALETIQADIIRAGQSGNPRIARALENVPTEISHLVQICTQLSDLGHILFLHNRDSPLKSFVILHSEELLSLVNKTIFSPADLSKRCQLETSTGVVPKSKIASTFPEYDPDMIVSLLCHFELAVIIDNQASLQQIHQHVTKCSEEQVTSEVPVSSSTIVPHSIAEDSASGVDEVFASSTSSEGFISITAEDTVHTKGEPPSCQGTPAEEAFLFFPALVTLEAPCDIFQNNLLHRFGWVLQCSRDEDFLTSQFAATLILRLALSREQAPLVNEEVPTLQCHCSVWKNGVTWSTNGAEVVVEIIDKKKVLVLIQAGKVSSLTELQKVILVVVEVAKEFCPDAITEEKIVAPAFVGYQLDPKAIIVSLRSVAECIANGEQFVYFGDDDQKISVNNLRPDGSDQLFVFASRDPKELFGIVIRPPSPPGQPQEQYVSDRQLDTKVTEHDLLLLADCFGDYNDFVQEFGLSEAEKTDASRAAVEQRSVAAGIRVALACWLKHTQDQSFRELLSIVQKVGKSQIVRNILDYIKDNIVSSK